MLTRRSIPESLPVTLEEAKAHLRVDQDNEDSTIQIYLDAATEAVEQASGRAFAQALYSFTCDAWPCHPVDYYGPYIEIPVAPIVAVSSVSYRDEDGAETLLDADHWTFRETESGGRVYFTEDFEAPTLWGRPGDVVVDLVAGYDAPDYSEGEDPELKLPKMARSAILLLVGHLYANRESVVVGRGAIEVPQSVQWLIDKFRIYR